MWFHNSAKGLNMPLFRNECPLSMGPKGLQFNGYEEVLAARRVLIVLSTVIQDTYMYHSVLKVY